MTHPTAGSLWKHRKGGTYVVIGVAVGCGGDLELKPVVVYESTGDEPRDLWVRGLEEFLDGRFTFICN